MSSLIIAIVGAVLLVLFIAMFVLSRIKVAGPNEAFIVTGRKGRAIRAADGSMVTDLSGQKVVMGAAVFVLPVAGMRGSSGAIKPTSGSNKFEASRTVLS